MEIYPIRTTHQKISITTIGTVDFPAPRRIPAIQWEKASRKKKKVSVRAWLVPKAII